MKKSQTRNYLSPVPNNPRDNELYVDKQERGREKKFNRDNVIFGSTEKESRYGGYRTAAGHWKNRDEPDPDTEMKQADAVNKMLQRRKSAAGRDRLKTQNKVPTRVATGKKLFEQFCKEAYRNTKKNIDDADMRNIYNSAQHLSYEEWVWFVNDEYSGRI
jgi:hypothetical protein